MKITLSPQAAGQVQAEAIAIPIAAGRGLPDEAAELDRAAGGVVSEIISRGEHRGRLLEIMPVHLSGQLPTRRLLLYGLGSLRDMDGQRMRWAHHELIRTARTYGYRSVAILRTSPLEDANLAAVVEGSIMGSWEQRSRQSGRRDRGEFEELTLVGFGTDREREVVAAEQLGNATNRAREWVNLPSNMLTPEHLAEEARRMARRYELEIEVLGPDELRAGGYNLLMAVAQGSTMPPRMIRLRHRGAGQGPVLALVGKGITFDSGGISIKPAEGMQKMKGDMGGAAAVLAAFEVIAHRRLPIDVMAILACCENMPSGSSMKPGDVFTAAGGKTVEVVNTDAEGRLVLADAITHALRQGATHIVDLATLTGAAATAIGHAATAAVSNDDALWARVFQAADTAGDRVWRLPIYADYSVLLQSKYADLKNAYYGQAGAIMGGMFIEQFVDGKPWVHLDIAASSWNDKGDLTTIPRAPTGAGTRICVQLAELMAAEAR
ncbi:MAG: leucyl aminopeptidase [Candidatus Dormibacteraeota bacterium]|nr:leucyl aminopeptidase [Candidatus Dormibacteraeota bacterium]